MPAGRGKNGAPKQVEKVDSISEDDPISVEPTFAVYPLKKWYAAASLESIDTGGRTPVKSQVRKITVFGSPA